MAGTVRVFLILLDPSHSSGTYLLIAIPAVIWGALPRPVSCVWSCFAPLHRIPLCREPSGTCPRSGVACSEAWSCGRRHASGPQRLPEFGGGQSHSQTL